MPLSIKILPAGSNLKDTVQKLGRFYAYDMSEYMGKLQPGWEFPEDGLYEAHDFSQYWTDSGRYPFIIRVEGELAGFVLINKVGSSSDVEWNMGEFFVVRKFKRQGIGRYVAHWCFDHFPGIWEVVQMPGNEGAIAFWKAVVTEYTSGCFEEALKEITVPEPRPMIVLKFQAPQREHTQTLPPLKG